MPKIILSSCDFGNTESKKIIYENLPNATEKCSVLYFPNEKSTEEDINSGKYKKRISKFGFDYDNVFVYNYFQPQEFDRERKFDIVYISGGNTFGTMKRIRESGADEVIRNLVHSGAVYIGGSAGAHIAARSFEHAAEFDKETFGMTDFSGLGLFDGVLICHYDDGRLKCYKKLIENGEKNIVILRNCDSIVIEI